ncbi:class I adenylate-forming enzyme family protein [Sphaerisporangium rubeum]|uniref:Acyl-CoA synthetase (AMP-forming)/AMP-acid ligase II n=1 Tax=Sphaerisporangium rubeum TaxID=321317 RepID=A0A7X0IIA7_9ACTN|nr:class I adenylate-forming enzyme family protein [Sphaerisporangium rubeum]MBB6475681.1 acyl-CoA synthetase (AMP-forming)/AMP-acid ligase II [Sphaerisporangium rubeum]
MTTLPEMAHARDKDLVALTVDGTRSLTAGQWLHAAEATAARLPATRTALLHDDADWLTHAVASLAVHMAGGTVVGLSPHLPRAELRARMERCEVAGLLHGDDVKPPATTAWTASPETLGTLDVPGAGHPPSPSDDHVTDIIYTSGTTGTPKPVAVPLANLTFGHEGRGRLFTGVDGVLAAVPIGTNAGHSAIMTAITAPTTVHVLSRQDPKSVAQAIEKLKVSMAIVAPSTATRMVALDLHHRHDLTSLKILMLGSAPVPTPTVKALAEALPTTTIVLGYGSTESAPAFVSRPLPPGTPLDGHLGPPSPGTDLTITDPDGHPVPPGELGEIRLRSAAPSRQYYKDPESTAKVWQDGWTRMGDLGHVDDQGHLHFFDRAADALTASDGTPVSSLRVEQAFLWHPAVAETAAFQTPDGITTAIVLRAAADVKDLKKTAADHLSPHEHPSKIILVDSLPRGPIGKTLKRELRHQATPKK